MTKTEDPNRANDLTRKADVAGLLNLHPAPWRHSSDADPEIVVDADGGYLVEMPTAELARLVVAAVNAYAPKPRRHLVDRDGTAWGQIGDRDLWNARGARTLSDPKFNPRSRNAVVNMFGPLRGEYTR